MIKQLTPQRMISAQLLNESNQISKSSGINSPYLLQVVCGVIVDVNSNQRMIPTMVCLDAFVKDRRGADVTGIAQCPNANLLLLYLNGRSWPILPVPNLDGNDRKRCTVDIRIMGGHYARRGFCLLLPLH